VKAEKVKVENYNVQVTLTPDEAKQLNRYLMEGPTWTTSYGRVAKALSDELDKIGYSPS
jgi:hypothetical protein